MSSVVVDASVAMKWFVPEVHSAASAMWLDHGHDLLAPDLIFPEVGSILWKKVGRKELTAAEARRVLRAFERVGVRSQPSRELLQSALEIALGLGRTVYDGMYLSLAVHRDVAVVTADRKLYEAVARSSLRRHVRWVEESPSTIA